MFEVQILSILWVSWFFASSLPGRYQDIIRAVLISGSSVHKAASQLIQVVGRIVSHSCRTEVPIPCWLLTAILIFYKLPTYFGSWPLITIFKASSDESSQFSNPSDFPLCHISLLNLQFHSSHILTLPALSIFKVQQTSKRLKHKHNSVSTPTKCRWLSCILCKEGYQVYNEVQQDLPCKEQIVMFSMCPWVDLEVMGG